MSTSIYSIAAELKSIYLKEPSRNSETGEKIKMSIDSAEIKTNAKGIDKDEAVVDYFEKRIKRAVEAFRKDTTELDMGRTKDSSNILPKPIFDILEYDKMACVRFLMAYFEESDYLDEKDNKAISKRKAKYVYDYNVDIDKNYDFIYKVLGRNFVKPASLGAINDKFNEAYCEVRHWITDKAKEYFKCDNIHPKDIPFKRYENILRIAGQDNTRYVFILAMLWIATCRGIKGNKLLQNIPWGEKGRFRLLWKLWMWIWMQTIYYLLLEKIDKVNNGDIDKLKTKMKELEKEIDNNAISMNKSDEIFQGYFMYNFLLMIRDETIRDAELQQSLLTTEGNKHYSLPDELCFVQNDNKLKEWFKSINEIDMQKYFDFGDEKCSTQTFKSRISFCEKFVEVYNYRAGRRLDFEDLRTQRAIYRAFYVDKVKINRRALVTIAKNIINKGSYEGIGTEHDLLGNVISSELITEFYQGERILRIKNDIILSIYSIGLKVFYRYFPCFEKNEKGFQEALDKLEYYFIETIDTIYENLYKL